MDQATILQNRLDVLNHMLAPERVVRHFLKATHPAKPEALECAERVSAALDRLFGRLVNIVQALEHRLEKPLSFVHGAMPCRYGVGPERPTIEDPWARCALLVEDTRVSLADASAYIRPIPLEADPDEEHGAPLFRTLGEELFRAVNVFRDELREEGATSKSAGIYCALIEVIFNVESQDLLGLHRLLSIHFGELFLMYEADEYEAAAKGEPHIPVLLFQHEYEAVQAKDAAETTAAP
ncbi:hypothetical protein [Oceanidesulfovibrio marinus]|uniref:Uncharacterized protein n=1 Tax=Oceanidesulfovibrio marinus TaxID=370038 RepID=A0A6P1ZFN7_9BACT|nr:hypothetical protein [Oceanidesulfovibrio marinus]TVM32132.1 hypothetical protein DQK91_16515 [Oceanidesulfovibrio marinus]